ncbi:MAG: 4-hydroxy-tetrahydrodipicolinate synthase [Saprospiraceae bacterium]|nr:4-hydroxy-tetrahydrodipicolinate synthase [Saprospiraceae bacterium]
MLLRGTGVALVTPFKNGAVDFDGLRNVIEHVINGGVEYVVSLGTTGETPTLDEGEMIKVLDFTVQVVSRRVPVVAGFGGYDTRAVVKAIQNYHFDGVDAILSSSPAYNKPTQEGLYQHYMAIAAVSPRPIIIYNVPGRTAKNIKAETTLRLAHSSDKFIAVKEASGNLVQCMKIMRDKPEHFQLLSGDDALALPMISFGAVGVISVIGNAFPNEFSTMIRHALNGDFVTATQEHLPLLEINDLLYVEGNPAGVKAALKIQGICRKEVRLPLVSLSDKSYAKLKSEIAIFKNIRVSSFGLQV